MDDLALDFEEDAGPGGLHAAFYCAFVGAALWVGLYYAVLFAVARFEAMLSGRGLWISLFQAVIYG